MEKFDFDPITARFVRLYATASNGVGSAKPISIWEMEIYEEVNNSLTVDVLPKILQSQQLLQIWIRCQYIIMIMIIL